MSVAPGAPVTVPITLTEGSEVDIRAYPDELADIRLVLFDPAATPIEEMNDWTFGSESIDVDEVPASGTYLLEVSTLDAATDALPTLVRSGADKFAAPQEHRRRLARIAGRRLRCRLPLMPAVGLWFRVEFPVGGGLYPAAVGLALATPGHATE